MIQRKQTACRLRHFQQNHAEIGGQKSTWRNPTSKQYVLRTGSAMMIYKTKPTYSRPSLPHSTVIKELHILSFYKRPTLIKYSTSNIHTNTTSREDISLFIGCTTYNFGVPYRIRVDKRTCGGNQYQNSMAFAFGRAKVTHKVQPTPSRPQISTLPVRIEMWIRTMRNNYNLN